MDQDYDRGHPVMDAEERGLYYYLIAQVDDRGLFPRGAAPPWYGTFLAAARMRIAPWALDGEAESEEVRAKWKERALRACTVEWQVYEVVRHNPQWFGHSPSHPFITGLEGLL